MTATRSFARRALRWGCVALMLSMAWFSAAQRAGAIDPIQGVGFIPEEGEYLSDQMWSNDDWINVGVELVTSGGTMTIGLLFYAEQYAVSSFFQAYVKPIEFWLNMVQEWRYETGLRAPEDFRMIGGMMMDRRVDITWLQVACADLSRREGWNYVFPIPWATQDDGAALREVDSWFDLGDRGLPDENEPVPPAGTGSNPDAPPITPQLQNAITSQGPSDPDIPTIPIPVRNGRTGIERIQASTNSSKLFQRYLNQLGKAGYLEKSLGIPRGSTFIDLTYDAGVHGVDGFFMELNGKCYLLEAKWFDRGGGKLGENRGRGLSGRRADR